jgi:hypothetical protein
MGRDCSVGRATLYAMDGLRIECRSHWPSGLRRGSAGSNPTGGMDICVLSTDKKVKCSTMKTNKYGWSTEYEKIPKIPYGSEIFRTRSDLPWGPPSLLYNGYRVSFPGVKLPEYGVNHPPPSNAEIKERVELYLYSPCGPSWPVLGRTLPLPLSHMSIGTKLWFVHIFVLLWKLCHIGFVTRNCFWFDSVSTWRWPEVSVHPPPTPPQEKNFWTSMYGSLQFTRKSTCGRVEGLKSSGWSKKKDMWQQTDFESLNFAGSGSRP